MKCASLSIQPLLSCLAALPIPASSISCNRISVAYDSRPRPLHQEGGTSGADAVGTGWLQAIQVFVARRGCRIMCACGGCAQERRLACALFGLY